MKCEVETKDKYHDDDECSNYSDFDSASQKKTSSGRKTKPPTNVIYILSSFDDLIYIYIQETECRQQEEELIFSCVLGHFFGSTFYDFDFYILLQFQFLHYYDFNFKPAFGYFSFFIFEFSGICYLIVFIMCESYHNNKCLIYI